jgi:pectate lyase
VRPSGRVAGRFDEGRVRAVHLGRWTLLRRGLLFAVLAGEASACADVQVDPFAPAPDPGSIGNGTCPASMVGFATVAASSTETTGGGSAASVSVTSLDELVSAAASTEPSVIVVHGMISVPTASQPFQVDVQSNKTILAADSQSGLTGGGFIVDGTDNVIIQNLVVSFPVGTDAITVQAAQHVWIDHCELFSDITHSTSYYGWLLNIKHGTDFVTVSWSTFHDHFNTIQIGHSDSNGAEDMGHLTVTLHHNSFAGTASGTPRVRFGTIHTFNNHYQNVTDYAVASQDGAQVLVASNVFDTVAVPLTNTHEMTPPGALGDVTNRYSSDSGPNQLAATGAPAFTFTAPPYAYTPDSTDSVPAIVAACAGPGKL